MDDWSSLRSFSRLKKLQMRDITVGTDSFWFLLLDLSLTKLAVLDVLFPTGVLLLGVICLMPDHERQCARTATDIPKTSQRSVLHHAVHVPSDAADEALFGGFRVTGLVDILAQDDSPGHPYEIPSFAAGPAASDREHAPSTNPEDREPTWSLLHPELLVSRNEASAIAQPDGRECGSDPVRCIGRVATLDRASIAVPRGHECRVLVSIPRQGQPPGEPEIAEAGHSLSVPDLSVGESVWGAVEQTSGAGMAPVRIEWRPDEAPLF